MKGRRETRRKTPSKKRAAPQTRLPELLAHAGKRATVETLAGWTRQERRTAGAWAAAALVARSAGEAPPPPPAKVAELPALTAPPEPTSPGTMGRDGTEVSSMRLTGPKEDAPSPALPGRFDG